MLTYVAAAALILVCADTGDSAPAGQWKLAGDYSSTEPVPDSEPADGDRLTDGGSKEATSVTGADVGFVAPPSGGFAGDAVAVAGNDDLTSVWATADAPGSEHARDVANALYQVEGGDYELSPDSGWAYGDDFSVGEGAAASDSDDAYSLSRRLLERILRSAEEWAAEQASRVSVARATATKRGVDAASTERHPDDR